MAIATASIREADEFKDIGIPRALGARLASVDRPDALLELALVYFPDALMSSGTEKQPPRAE